MSVGTVGIERKASAEVGQRRAGAATGGDPAASLPRHRAVGIDGKTLGDQQLRKIKIADHRASGTQDSQHLWILVVQAERDSAQTPGLFALRWAREFKTDLGVSIPIDYLVTVGTRV